MGKIFGHPRQEQEPPAIAQDPQEKDNLGGEDCQRAIRHTPSKELLALALAP